MSAEVSIIGMGRLGKTLANALLFNGYNIVSIISSRGTTPSDYDGIIYSSIEEAPHFGEITFICVPDDTISEVARKLATSSNLPKVATHVSGALNSEELLVLAQKGVKTASFHPMMTFTEKSSSAMLKNCLISIEGESDANQLLTQIAINIGARPEIVDKEQKTSRHLVGVFLSNFMSVLVDLASEILESNHENPQKFILENYDDLLRQTLDNIIENGLPGAITGPAVRGDANTLDKHLKILQKNPELAYVYKMFSKRIIDISSRYKLADKGKLDASNRILSKN
jgi:predicted short-subunit dehydrogenase-like oxidoreductase (DUF2520 family)